MQGYEERRNVMSWIVFVHHTHIQTSYSSLLGIFTNAPVLRGTLAQSFSRCLGGYATILLCSGCVSCSSFLE